MILPSVPCVLEKVSDTDIFFCNRIRARLYVIGYCDKDKSRISHTPAQPKRSLRLPAIDSANTNPRRYSSNHGSEFSQSEGVGDVNLPTTILHR